MNLGNITRNQKTVLTVYIIYMFCLMIAAFNDLFTGWDYGAMFLYPSIVMFAYYISYQIIAWLKNK